MELHINATDFDIDPLEGASLLHVMTVTIEELCNCMNILEYFVLHNERNLTADDVRFTKSYKCDSQSTHSFHSNESNNTALVRTTFLQLQAFEFNNKNGDFGSG